MKRILWISLCVTALLAVLCALLPALAADYVPIQASSSVDPKSITGPGNVNVTIRIVNTADGDITNPVVLYDPAGTRIQEWPSLKAEASVTYTGSWSVTADELKDGKLKYKVSYTTYDEESGQNKTGSMVVSVPIAQASASAKLNADYTITPTAANKGQTVTLNYTLSNVGNVAVTDVTITNPNLTDKKLTISNIPAGQRVTRAMDVTMGSKALTSKPKVTYKAEGSDKVETIANMPQKTIELAQSGLTVNLSATDTAEVLPNETVELNCVVENTGNLTYTNIRIVDETLGEIASGVDLKPGEKHTEKRTITVTQSQDYTFVVTAEDSTGSQVTVPSNTLSVIAVDLSQKLQLSVSAEANKATISAMPEVVGFSIHITNEGESTGTEITVNHGTTTVAGLAELLPGESVTFVKEFDVTMGGQFQFVVSGKGGQGIKEDFPTNTILIPYIAPTAEPAPTPAPVLDLATPEPEPTPAPSLFAAGGWILYVGIGLFALLVILLVLFLVMRKRGASSRGGDADNALGSMRTGSRRGYAGGKRREGDEDGGTSWDDEDVSLYDGIEDDYDDRDLPDDVALSAAQAEMRKRSARDAYEDEDFGQPSKRKRSYEEEEERYGRPDRRGREETGTRRGRSQEDEDDFSRWEQEPEAEETPPAPQHRSGRQSRSARRAMSGTGRWNPEEETEETPRQVPYHGGQGAGRDQREAGTSESALRRQDSFARQQTGRMSPAEGGWDSAYRAQDAFAKQQTGRASRTDSAWNSAYRAQDSFTKERQDTGRQPARGDTGWGDSAHRSQSTFRGETPEEETGGGQQEAGWDSAYQASGWGQGTSGAAAPLRQDTGFYRLQRQRKEEHAQQQAAAPEEPALWETSPFDVDGDDSTGSGTTRRRKR